MILAAWARERPVLQSLVALAAMVFDQLAELVVAPGGRSRAWSAHTHSSAPPAPRASINAMYDRPDAMRLARTCHVARAYPSRTRRFRRRAHRARRGASAQRRIHARDRAVQEGRRDRAVRQ